MSKAAKRSNRILHQSSNTDLHQGQPQFIVLQNHAWARLKGDKGGLVLEVVQILLSQSLLKKATRNWLKSYLNYLWRCGFFFLKEFTLPPFSKILRRSHWKRKHCWFSSTPGKILITKRAGSKMLITAFSNSGTCWFYTGTSSWNSYLFIFKKDYTNIKNLASLNKETFKNIKHNSL